MNHHQHHNNHTLQTMCLPPASYTKNATGKRPRTVSACLEDTISMTFSSSACSTLQEMPRLITRLDCYEPQTYEPSGKRARTSKVRFSHQEATVLEATSPLDMITPAEALQLWYQKQDFLLNQIEARNHILHGVQVEHTRGYERYEMDRVKYKSLAMKCIYLIAQQPTLTQEDIAQVARECTACARRQAVLTGTEDFFGAYFDP